MGSPGSEKKQSKVQMIAAKPGGARGAVLKRPHVVRVQKKRGRLNGGRENTFSSRAKTEKKKKKKKKKRGPWVWTSTGIFSWKKKTLVHLHR